MQAALTKLPPPSADRYSCEIDAARDRGKQRGHMLHKGAAHPLRGAARTALLATPGCVIALLFATFSAGAGASSYVAIGDSYTSGPGLAPYEGPPECARSSINYAHLVAGALGLTLDDVSCAGASRLSFTSAQYPGQPPQFDALTAATEVVSVSMGGNDNSIFGRLASGCAETDSSDTSDRGAPCKRKYGNAETGALKQDVTPYTEALAQIHALAPQAKVFVVGYPQLASPSGHGCFQSLPWSTQDFHWGNSVELKLNSMLAKAAKKDGYTYVDTFTPSAGHDVCEPLGTRWIEPLIDPADGAALHPNALGQEADARALESAMRAQGIG